MIYPSTCIMEYGSRDGMGKNDHRIERAKNDNVQKTALKVCFAQKYIKMS